MTPTDAKHAITVRCRFCLKLNRVDLARASERPKCGECERPILLDRPLKVAEEDFDRTVLGADAAVVVDFYADWCAPCKLVAPLLDKLAADYVGRLFVTKVDTDAAQGIAQRYGIRSIPTLVFFKAGEEVDRSLGFEPERVKGLVESIVQ